MPQESFKPTMRPSDKTARTRYFEESRAPIPRGQGSGSEAKVGRKLIRRRSTHGLPPPGGGGKKKFWFFSEKRLHLTDPGPGRIH